VPFFFTNKKIKVMTQKTKKINVEINLNKPLLSEDIMFCLLVSALEGGSNYWYFLPDTSMLPKKGYEPKTELNKSQLKSDAKFDLGKNYRGIDCFVNKMWEAVMLGAKIPVVDINEYDQDKEKADDDDILGYITKESLIKATYLMAQEYSIHFADAISENSDAITGDVFFQLTVMEDVVFG